MVQLRSWIFVKYDGKDASKCAMRGLRGDALRQRLLTGRLPLEIVWRFFFCL